MPTGLKTSKTSQRFVFLFSPFFLNLFSYLFLSLHSIFGLDEYVELILTGKSKNVQGRAAQGYIFGTAKNETRCYTRLTPISECFV